jgi:hypothetical protein
MVVAAGTDGGAGEIVRPVVVKECRLVVQRKLRTGIAGSRGVRLLSTTGQLAFELGGQAAHAR